MLTKEELIENYQKFDDEKIVILAKNESKSLMEEVIPILENEILKRNLDKKLIDWIKLERNFYKGFELETLKNKIKSSTCTECQQQKDVIKGYHIHFRSFMDTTFDAKIIVCKSCGQKLRIQSYLKTATLGWLSLRGLLSVPIYFIGELFSSFSREKTSETIIESFIYNNTGLIREYGFDRIEDLIAESNKLQVIDETPTE
jgi:RNase P subunit RPR2